MPSTTSCSRTNWKGRRAPATSAGRPSPTCSATWAPPTGPRSGKPWSRSTPTCPVRPPPSWDLPHVRTVRHFKTDNVRLFPADNIIYSDITIRSSGSASGSSPTSRTTSTSWRAGSRPRPPPATRTVPIEVLISAAMADEIGIQSGENFMTFRRARTDEGTRTIQVPVVVTGGLGTPGPDQRVLVLQPEHLRDGADHPGADLRQPGGADLHQRRVPGPLVPDHGRHGRHGVHGDPAHRQHHGSGAGDGRIAVQHAAGACPPATPSTATSCSRAS